MSMAPFPLPWYRAVMIWHKGFWERVLPRGIAFSLSLAQGRVEKSWLQAMPTCSGIVPKTQSETLSQRHKPRLTILPPAALTLPCDTCGTPGLQKHLQVQNRAFKLICPGLTTAQCVWTKWGPEQEQQTMAGLQRFPPSLSILGDEDSSSSAAAH